MRAKSHQYVVGVMFVSLLIGACSPATPASPTAAKPAADKPAAAAAPTQASAPASAPAAPAAPAAKGGAASGTLTIVQGVDVSTLDPQKTGELTADNVFVNLFDRLVYRDKDAKLIPELATSWRTIDDTTWEFKLREGVKFHNGEAFDANAVKFSIERAKNPAIKSPQAAFINVIKEVQVVDPSTVRMVTDGPLPSLPSRLTTVNGNILPPKYLAEKGDDAFGRDPVGTGRFKFKEWTKDDHLTLEANPDYWGDKARIQTVIFKPVPESATRISVLKSGQADIITNLSPDQADAFTNDPDAAAASVPSGLMIQSQIDTLTPGPLQDRRVRQALNYAVDKEAIVKNILRGHGKVQAVNISPEYYGFNPNLKPYPYDPEKARALLKEAGVDPNFSLTIATPTGRYLADKVVTEAVADYITKVGIKTSVNVMEWGDYLAKRGTGRGPLALNGWAASNTFQTELTLVPIFKTGDPNSVYSNPEFDQIVDQAVRSLDEGKRIELLHKGQQMIHEDAARLFLHQQNSIFGIRKRTDFQPRPDDQLYIGTSTVK